MPQAAEEVLKVSVGGVLTLPDGTVKNLRLVGDAEWVEGWLRRSVSPCALWSLTTPLLPIAEGLTTPVGAPIFVMGLEGDGSLAVVLLDLHLERPFCQVLGEGLAALQWAEQLDERQLETFARTFWRDRHISLRSAYERAFSSPSPPTLGITSKVQILSWRSWDILAEMQQFLQQRQLPFWLFRLWVLQTPEGEAVALTELAISSPAAGARVPLSFQRFGSGDLFLRSLQGSEEGRP
ncbi:MAG: hypothetical protein LKKZDAJK_002794 [Candidatus Fervidibacter sp.]